MQIGMILAGYTQRLQLLQLLCVYIARHFSHGVFGEAKVVFICRANILAPEARWQRCTIFVHELFDWTSMLGKQNVSETIITSNIIFQLGGLCRRLTLANGGVLHIWDTNITLSISCPQRTLGVLPQLAVSPKEFSWYHIFVDGSIILHLTISYCVRN